MLRQVDSKVYLSFQERNIVFLLVKFAADCNLEVQSVLSQANARSLGFQIGVANCKLSAKVESPATVRGVPHVSVAPLACGSL